MLIAFKNRHCISGDNVKTIFYLYFLLIIMKSPLFIAFAMVWLTGAYAQRFVEPDKMKSFNITVNYPEYTVKTQMLKDAKKISTDVELTYHWYMAQKIMETKGGFDGKLLHGTYRSFYLNDQLFESGEFKYGVKSGEWKNWYPDGKLKEITHWKKGRKNGKYSLYNNFGKLMATGTFKNDLLTGTFTTYDPSGNVSSKRTYKKGKEVIKQKKVKKSKKQKDTATPERTDKPAKEKKGLFRKKKGADVKDADKTTESGTAEPKTESKQKADKTQKKQDKKASPSIEEDHSGSSTSKEKKTFGEKVRSLFKKKEKSEDPKKTAKKTSVTT